MQLLKSINLPNTQLPEYSLQIKDKTLTKPLPWVLDHLPEIVNPEFLAGAYSSPEAYEKLTASFPGDSLTITIDLGLDLLREITRYSSWRKRYLVDSLHKNITGYPDSFTVLFGTRRTGKTVAMWHEVQNLIYSGVPLNEIAFITLREQGISHLEVHKAMRLLSKMGIQYLFIDEITFCESNMNFLIQAAEGRFSPHIVVAGTHSAVFISAFDSVLYGRCQKVMTSYISFKEFDYLYGDQTVDDYIACGGLLRSSADYERLHKFDLELYKQEGVEYIGTSIVDNLFNCFKHGDLSSVCPKLQDLYWNDRNQLRVMIFKWMQRYAQELTIGILKSDLTSDDIGNLAELLSQHTEFDDIDVFKERLFDNLRLDLQIYDYDFFEPSLAKELKAILERMGCFMTCPEIKSEFLFPIIMRWGYTCETILTLMLSYVDLVSGTDISYGADKLREILINSASGGLIEAMIYMDLHKMRIPYYKFKSEAYEIDLVIPGTGSFEIKHSNKVVPEQCKWLLSSKAPGIPHVIYTGESKIEPMWPRQLYRDLADKARDGEARERFKKEYDLAVEGEVMVQFINVNDFLRNLDKYCG